MRARGNNGGGKADPITEDKKELECEVMVSESKGQAWRCMEMY